MFYNRSQAFSGLEDKEVMTTPAEIIPLKELLKQTLETNRVYIHKPSGLKIGLMWNDCSLPASCVELEDHPPIKVLSHIYVTTLYWECISGCSVERIEDMDNLLQICESGPGRDTLIVISEQALAAMKELVTIP